MSGRVDAHWAHLIQAAPQFARLQHTRRYQSSWRKKELKLGIARGARKITGENLITMRGGTGYNV